MKPELKEAWVKALRSGDYKQGQGALKWQGSGAALHCCLGVLCEVAGLCLKSEVGLNHSLQFDGDMSSTGGLGVRARSFVGLPYDVHVKLWKMNDYGDTFEQIADYIEQSQW